MGKSFVRGGAGARNGVTAALMARVGYDAPRDILKMLGCDLVEMGRNRDNSFCCGAGGGRIWIPDPVGVEKPSQN